MRERSEFKFCKAKITTYDEILKHKKFDLKLDDLRISLPLPNLPFIRADENNRAENNNGNNFSIRSRSRIDFYWENISPDIRESILNFFEEKRIYYPDRKVKMCGRFFKFQDRPKPNPPFTKKLLEKKTLVELKEICKTHNISMSNKGKAEIVSAIMRFQRRRYRQKRKMF